MSTDHYLNMIANLSDDLSKTLEGDDLDKMSEDELLSLLDSLQAFNRKVDSIVGIHEDDFDLEQAELLLSELDSFFSEEEIEDDSILTRFDNLGKSLCMGTRDENQYKN